MISTLSFPAVGHFHMPEADKALRVAHDYQMELTRICRRFRERYQALVREAFPDLGEASGRVDDLKEKEKTLVDQIKSQRKSTRSGKAQVPPELKEVRAELKAAKLKAKEINDRLRGSAELKAATAQLNIDEQNAYKEARSKCGLPAAIYITVEENFRRAKKMAGVFGPPVRPYQGNGRLAVQVPAIGGADRLVYAALEEADLHVTAAQALEEAGKIKLVMGRPRFVNDEGKSMDLVEGLRQWRQGDGAEYAGHNAAAAAAKLSALAPLRTMRDLAQGRISGARIVWMARSEWVQVAYPTAPQRPTENSRRERDFAYGLLILRISRDGAEITLPFRAARDRLPPPEAQIKWVYAHRRRIAYGETRPRYQWRVLLTVDDPTPRPAMRSGVVAVNYGWRQRPEGKLRVAYWVGDDGAHGEIAIDRSIVEGIQKADEIRSINDQRFDLAKAQLNGYLAALAVWPEWVVEYAKGLPQWRSGGKMARFIEKWRENRLPGDEEVFRQLAGPILEPVVDKQGNPLLDHEGKAKMRDVCWLRKWRHLRAWESAQREKMLTRRREFFRNTGKMLRERYGTLLTEDFDLTEQRTKAPADEATAGEKTVLVRQMNLAAPGLLREIHRTAFTFHGGQEITESVPLATQRCESCGSEERWDAAKSILHSCSKCGATAVDQDWQNGRNRLRHYLERIEQEPQPAAG